MKTIARMTEGMERSIKPDNFRLPQKMKM